jgi:ABC-type multidrug transport system fused ATPase/permease subunit
MRQVASKWMVAMLLGLLFSSWAIAENASTMERVKDQASQIMAQGMEKAGELGNQAQAKLDEAAANIQQSEQAKKLSAGILQPIYQLAEMMSFSAFYWLAFAFMFVGVVSFALQLVLGKLVVAISGGFSLTEIISDAVGLIISLIGLVLTTQAATENSTFTHSPIAVLTSAAVGVVLGIVLYRWGQAQEVQAVRGREG